MTPVEQLRNPEATLAEVRQAISELAPEDVQWWAFSVSHKWFMIRAYTRDSHIMIAMFGCERICGPTAWQHPSLDIKLSYREDLPGTVCRWVISDNAVGFEVQASNLYWGNDSGISEYDGWFGGTANPDLPHE